jgi:hypothetical protein
MCEPAEGEFIAESASCSNARDKAGAETLEGLSRPVFVFRTGGRGRLSEDRSILWDAGGPAIFCRSAKRVRGGGRKLLPRFLPENPRRAKPMGGSSGRRAKPPIGCQELLGGSKPRNRDLLGRPTASAAGTMVGRTVCGFIRVVTLRIPTGRRNLRRVNPKSAAGAKKNRQGIAGSKTPGG